MAVEASLRAFAPLCNITVSLDLLNIVNQTIHQPLCIHLLFAPQAKTTQTFGGIDIAEYGLNSAETTTVHMPASATVYFGLHFLHRAGQLIITAIYLDGNLPSLAFDGLAHTLFQ